MLLKKLRDCLSKVFQDIPPDVWIAYIHPEDRERINEKVMKIQNKGENTGKSSGSGKKMELTSTQKIEE